MTSGRWQGSILRGWEFLGDPLEGMVPTNNTKPGSNFCNGGVEIGDRLR